MKRVKRENYDSAEEQLENLPLEIVAEIVARLPLKSILTFRCVCKSWYSLASQAFCASEKLALSHYAATKCRHNYMFVHHKNEFYAVPAEYYVSTPKDCRNVEPKKLNFPNMDAAAISSFSGKGSSNGLLCFSTGLDKFLLWNPLIGRVKEIPKSPQSQLRGGELVGFGFVSQTCDYKLVCIEDKVHHGFPQFETCTLRNPTWRTGTGIVDNSFDYQIDYTCRDKFCFPCVRSNLYFVARKRNRGSTEFAKDDGFVVLGFDMVEEKFREIPFPYGAGHLAMGRFVVGEYRDTVALFKIPWPINSRIWVMKDDDDENGCMWEEITSRTHHPPRKSPIRYTIFGEDPTTAWTFFDDILIIQFDVLHIEYLRRGKKGMMIPFVDRMVEYKEMSLALLDDQDCLQYIMKH